MASWYYFTNSFYWCIIFFLLITLQLCFTFLVIRISWFKENTIEKVTHGITLYFRLLLRVNGKADSADNEFWIDQSVWMPLSATPGANSRLQPLILPLKEPHLAVWRSTGLPRILQIHLCLFVYWFDVKYVSGSSVCVCVPIWRF